MATFTKNPTANQTPDSGQGGAAVTGASNTGHSSTTSSGLNGSGETKTCRWSAFTAPGGQITSLTLKFTHTSSGSLSNAGTNQFLVQYTLNGGGAWNTSVNRINFTSSQGPTVVSVSLSTTQDLTQVQVRDLIDAATVDIGDAASATATVSDIQIEIVTTDSQSTGSM